MSLIPDQLRRLADGHPDEVGFTVATGPGAGDITLGAWNVESARFARGLLRLGVAPGDRVALLLLPDDALRFVVAYAAAHKAGAVAVPVNVRLSPAEITGILRHCEPTVAVVSSALLHTVGQARGRVDSLRAVVAVTKPDDAADGVVAWDEVPTGPDSDLQVPRDPDDLAEILYTSGTTGAPKGVAVRHSNSALVVLAEPQWTGVPWLHASPMFTFAGLTFVYQPMRMGMRTLYMPRFDADDFLRLVEEQRPSACFVVPAMVELLLGHRRAHEADLSSLHLVSVGSAPIAPSTLMQLQELLPEATVANSYSMTEAGTAYFLLPKGEFARRPGSVGMPIPPAQVRIVDDAGRPLDTGEVGQILVKPAGRLREYYRDPAATAEVFGTDGWLRTGDLGSVDDDGYLYVVGRIKDVIIRGGYNIHASDVEHAIYEHPAVREAAVVGVPHPVLGEDLVAFVVLHEGMQATPEEITAHCRERLADYKVPRRVVFESALPRNATGKILKRELGERPDRPAD